MTRHKRDGVARKITTLRLPEPLLQRLDRYVQVNKHRLYFEGTLSRNAAIEQAIDEFLQKNKR